MRSICFPTLEEAEIALHMALMNSGWNLGTLTNLDAESPFLVAPHPKNQAQFVLSSGVEEETEATLQASKPRAKGKMQFCTGLVKHTSSPPFIVAAFLKRVAPLREQLKQQYTEAVKVLAQMQSSHADAKIVDGTIPESTAVARRASQCLAVCQLQRGCWLAELESAGQI